jgi:hypothetical protein
LLLQHAHALAHRRRAARDDGPLDQPDAPRAALCLHHAHEVGVGHRCQRMLAHRAVGQQHVADEQVALEHHAAVLRESRRDDGELGLQFGHQRFGDGADVAVCRGVERRADLEVDLCRTASTQPAAGSHRIGHGLFDGRGARLQCNDDRVGIDCRVRRGHADRLHDAHAGTHEVVGEVGRAGEIVSNTTQLERHACILMRCRRHKAKRQPLGWRLLELVAGARFELATFGL